MELKIMKASLLALALVLAAMVASPAYAAHPHMDHHAHAHKKHHPKHKAGKPYDHGHHTHHKHPHARHHKPINPPPKVDNEAPNTMILDGLVRTRPVGDEAVYRFDAFDPDTLESEPAVYECRTWGFDRDSSWPVRRGEGVPWERCSNPHSYPVTDHYYQIIQVRAVDRAGNADPTPAEHEYTTW